MIRPLHGITVLDLSRVLSGPFATQQLVDLGARILKIEHPKDGDDTRRFGPPFIAGESTYFMSVNRGKESVAIDLKHPKGRELVLDLARHADVALENFRPGTAERLGLGPDDLRKVQPKLVTCSISGFGADGHPDYAGLPGYDAVIQAVSGLMAITGEPTAEPTRVGVAIADMVAGLFAAQGILAALVERGRTGVGRHVEISMQDALTTMLTYQAGIYFGTGRSPKRLGNAHPSICPYETVQAKDGIYTIAIGNDAQFVKFCARTGLDELAKDPKFATNRARVENRPELMAILAPKFAEKTGAEWDRIFSEEGIPGGPVLEISQALEHPQLVARGSVLIHQHPVAGTIRTLATPVRIDRERPAEISPPPTLGEHTDPILRELLGLDDATLATLRADGAIGGPARPV
ncbi:CoA transferase [Myxococcota bacterium]|nr:CoA transferase [Myxococcota bacterium]